MHISERRSSESIFAIYNIHGTTAINFIDNKHTYLYTNISLKETDKNFKYSILPFWQNQKIKNYHFDSLDVSKTFNYYQFNDKRIINICNDSLFRFNPKTKLKVDYIVLSKNVDLEIPDLKNYFDFEQIIFDSSNSYYSIINWKNQCEKSNFKFYNVLENGAFIRYL